VRVLRAAGAVLSGEAPSDPILSSQIRFRGATWFAFGLALCCMLLPAIFTVILFGFSPLRRGGKMTKYLASLNRFISSHRRAGSLPQKSLK